VSSSAWVSHNAVLDTVRYLDETASMLSDEFYAAYSACRDALTRTASIDEARNVFCTLARLPATYANRVEPKVGAKWDFGPWLCGKSPRQGTSVTVRRLRNDEGAADLPRFVVRHCIGEKLRGKMNRFVVAAASAVLLAGTALANAQPQDITQEEHADTLSPAQGVSIIPCLPMATGTGKAQAHELVAALSNHWPSLMGEAKFLLWRRSNA
jgi:hypothetical protein